MDNFVDGVVEDLPRDSRGQRFPWKTGLLALFLFTVGSVCLVLGITELTMTGGKFDKGVALTVIGSMAFIPGGWAAYNLYGSILRWRGYTYDQIRTYEDE